MTTPDTSMLPQPKPKEVSLYDHTRESLETLLDGEPRYRIDQLWKGLYEQFQDPADISNLPKSLRAKLAAIPTALRTVTESVSDNGDTIKWLWELLDGTRVETVLMHYKDRSTVCISSQAGCAMDCSFCATGQAGFDRQLTTGEIVEQVIRAARRSAPTRVSNIVFMGMGEPMANYDRTWEAIDRLHNDFGISARHITVSTVGIIPGINRMADEDLPVNLAVSLHAANDILRDQLVPINKRYPLDDLVDACVDYFNKKGRRISFEWALINEVNDRPSDAYDLARIARECRAHINLIPLNPTPGYLVMGSPKSRVNDFVRELEHHGANVTVRRTRGTEIDAACGQLRAGHEIASPGTAVQVAAPIRRAKTPQ